jgi:hypothetical protein
MTGGSRGGEWMLAPSALSSWVAGRFNGTGVRRNSAYFRCSRRSAGEGICRLRMNAVALLDPSLFIFFYFFWEKVFV